MLHVCHVNVITHDTPLCCMFLRVFASFPTFSMWGCKVFFCVQSLLEDLQKHGAKVSMT